MLEYSSCRITEHEEKKGSDLRFILFRFGIGFFFFVVLGEFNL